MIVRPHSHWFRLLFIWRGSVLPRIAPRLALVLAVSVASVLARDGWMSAHASSALSIPPFTLMGIAIAIFLGFRNSVSYERWWEARKQWGELLIGARALAREVATFGADDPALARRTARSVAAMVFALKHGLRRTDPHDDLARRLEPALFERARAARNPASVILLGIAQDLDRARRAGILTDLQLQSIDRNLDRMTAAAGACERIAATPIPYTYRVLLNRTITVYCLLLPVGLTTTIGWLTPLVATFIAYTYVALDVIGEEIEEPFGTEPNDLALDAMSHGIEASICELVGEQPLSEPPPIRDYVLQ